MLSIFLCCDCDIHDPQVQHDLISRNHPAILVIGHWRAVQFAGKRCHHKYHVIDILCENCLRQEQKKQKNEWKVLFHGISLYLHYFYYNNFRNGKVSAGFGTNFIQ